MEKKQKRFYKKNEMVWVIPLKKEGKVVSVDGAKQSITVTVKNESKIEKITLPLWDVDKLKYSAKEKLANKKKTGIIAEGQMSVVNLDDVTKLMELVKAIMYPEVYFAKVRETAIIPSKRDEDAGYDIYANLENFKRETEDGTVYEIECPALTTTLVPTGLATAMPNTHYLNLKHERGSTGVQSMNVLAGVVDSGFRNEMFIALCPLHKSVIITSAVDKVEENDTHILYPLSKAIAQGTVDLVPKATIKELLYEDLLKIESERGLTMLGQSGK